MVLPQLLVCCLLVAAGGAIDKVDQEAFDQDFFAPAIEETHHQKSDEAEARPAEATDARPPAATQHDAGSRSREDDAQPENLTKGKQQKFNKNRHQKSAELKESEELRQEMKSRGLLLSRLHPQYIDSIQKIQIEDDLSGESKNGPYPGDRPQQVKSLKTDLLSKFTKENLEEGEHLLDSIENKFHSVSQDEGGKNIEYKTLKTYVGREEQAESQGAKNHLESVANSQLEKNSQSNGMPPKKDIRYETVQIHSPGQPNLGKLTQTDAANEANFKKYEEEVKNQEIEYKLKNMYQNIGKVESYDLNKNVPTMAAIAQQKGDDIVYKVKNILPPLPFIDVKNKDDEKKTNNSVYKVKNIQGSVGPAKPVPPSPGVENKNVKNKDDIVYKLKSIQGNIPALPSTDIKSKDIKKDMKAKNIIYMLNDIGREIAMPDDRKPSENSISFLGAASLPLPVKDSGSTTIHQSKKSQQPMAGVHSKTASNDNPSSEDTSDESELGSTEGSRQTESNANDLQNRVKSDLNPLNSDIQNRVKSDLNPLNSDIQNRVKSDLNALKIENIDMEQRRRFQIFKKIPVKTENQEIIHQKVDLVDIEEGAQSSQEQNEKVTKNLEHLADQNLSGAPGGEDNTKVNTPLQTKISELPYKPAVHDIAPTRMRDEAGLMKVQSLVKSAESLVKPGEGFLKPRERSERRDESLIKLGESLVKSDESLTNIKSEQAVSQGQVGNETESEISQIQGQQKVPPKDIAYKVVEPKMMVNGTQRLRALVNGSAIGTDPKLVTDQDHIKYNVVKQYKMFDEMTVAPAHLACIAKTVIDTPPKPGEDDFDSEFGLRSTNFQKLRQYLNGLNSHDTEIPFHYPVMVRATPHINNTITRTTCVIISHFDNKIPPAMENHLGILDLPQPMNTEIQLSTLGSVTKYVRSYSGNANDFIYRKQVKALMDTLVTSGLFEEVDLSSYCIGISQNGAETIYSIGFNKINRRDI